QTPSSPSASDPQLDERGLDGAGGGLTQTAYRRVPHRLRDLAKQRDVAFATICPARCKHPLQDLLLSLSPDTARDALPAGLVLEEARDAKQDLIEVGGVVQHDHRARPEGRADGPGPFEAEGHIQLLLG